MKRCPQCNRVESEETLKFCRVDGATLVSESSSVSDEAGPIKLVSGSVSSETKNPPPPPCTARRGVHRGAPRASPGTVLNALDANHDLTLTSPCAISLTNEP